LDERSGEESQDTLFSYLGTLSLPAYHVLWVQYYEGSAVMLVSVATAEKQLVDAVPVASPDGRYMAVASGDLGAAYNPNRLSVWAFVGDSLELVWAVEPEDWMPGRVRWIATTKFEVSKIVVDKDTGQERVIGTAVIQWDGKGWRFV
jgi:hypothetical protein